MQKERARVYVRAPLLNSTNSFYCGVWLLSLVPLLDASLSLDELELELSLLLPTPEVALLLDELPDSLPALLPELFGCSLVALPVLFVSNDPP